MGNSAERIQASQSANLEERTLGKSQKLEVRIGLGKSLAYRIGGLIL